MGLVFQVPVAILAATRLGIVTTRQLRRNRRYAIVVCAVVAAFLPGDLITLVLETVPLYLLYEASILIASFVGRHDASDSSDADAAPPASGEGAMAASSSGQPEPSVQQIIDHTDSDLSS